MNKKVSSESVVKDIRRRTRKKYSSEEKIRIVLDGLRGCGLFLRRVIAGTMPWWKVSSIL